MLDGSLRGAVRTPIDPRRTPARRPTKDIKSRPSVPSAKKGPTLWPPRYSSNLSSDRESDFHSEGDERSFAS
jgi:hypothetical protein